MLQKESLKHLPINKINKRNLAQNQKPEKNKI